MSEVSTETTQVRPGRPRGLPKTGGRIKGISKNKPKVLTPVPTAVAAGVATAAGAAAPPGGNLTVSGARTREATHPGLKIRYEALANLREYERNANQHPPEQIALIERLLAKFGWTTPMGKASGMLIYGHARRQAALNLRDRGVAIPRNPDPDKGPVVDLSHLSTMDRRAYVIADNESARKAVIDREMLGSELTDMHDEDADYDLTFTGLDEDQIAGYLDDPADLPGPGGGDPDEAMVTCPNCQHEFAP